MITHIRIYNRRTQEQFTAVQVNEKKGTGRLRIELDKAVDALEKLGPEYGLKVIETPS